MVDLVIDFLMMAVQWVSNTVCWDQRAKILLIPSHVPFLRMQLVEQGQNLSTCGDVDQTLLKVTVLLSVACRTCVL